MTTFHRLYIAAQRRPLVYLLLHVFVSTGLAYALMCLIFPDLFVKTNISFIRFADTEINFYGTFTLASNLFHGGIQLWDPYNQMPLAYFYTAVSMLSFSTLWTAFVYSMLAPFVSYPGQFFHVFYSRFYYVPAMVILCAGSYLLFRRFTKNPLLLIFLTMFCESLLLPQMYLGLNTESLFSFFPLLIHFILTFFENGRIRDAVYAVLMFSVCVGMFPLIAIGYFYQGIHFIVLATVCWWIVNNRKKIFTGLWIRKVGQETRSQLGNRHTVFLLFGAALLITFLIAPHMVMLRTTYKDYDIAHENSRFANYSPLHFTGYFGRESMYAAQIDFLSRLLNFTDNNWAFSWVFIGTLAVFFVLCGIVLSTDGRKYIFAVSILCYFLINSPRIMTGWQSVIHWINAITNPFNVAVRSMHMTGALMLSLVLAPLVAIGATAVFQPSKETRRRQIIRNGIVLLAFAIIAEQAMSFLSAQYSWYPVVGFFCVAGVLLSRMIRFPGYRVIMVTLAIILFAFDAYAMSHYLRLVAKQMDVRSYQLPTVATPAFLDYQNPLVLPLRQFYTAMHLEVHPYIVANPHNSREQFLRYTNYGLYFSPPDQYHARHIQYSRIAHDPVFQKYLLANDQLIFQANLAVPEQDGMLARILEQKQERSIIMVDHDPHMPGLYQAELPQPQEERDGHIVQVPVKTVNLPLDTATARQHGDIVFYHLPLPDDFPAYVTSSVFTRDSQMLSVKVGEREFAPGQGWLLQPYTYDVQNIQTGKLTLALPAGVHESQVLLSYAVPAKEGIQTVWLHQPDRFSFDYQTKTNGWLVFHSPYDRKWKLTLDGKEEEIYRANYSFIGIPLTTGRHTVKLEYWPETWLRPLLGITMLLVMSVPFGLIWIGVKSAKCEFPTV